MPRARIRPELRTSETYTESNFLRVHTGSPVKSRAVEAGCIATIEHLSCGPSESPQGWRCVTIVDREPMSKEDALFIAKHYAREHSVPVIYECHD